MTLCMKLKTNGGTRYELHMLNPGEVFPRFGGSSSGLLVRKTASCVLREMSSMGWRDVEYDIHDPSIWNWLANCINDLGVRDRATGGLTRTVIATTLESEKLNEGAAK